MVVSRLGVSPIDFWRLTPAEIFALADAYADLAEHQENGRITQAWMGAALERSKRLPKLERLLAVPAKPAKSKEQLQAEWEELNAKFPRLGGEIDGQR